MGLIDQELTPEETQNVNTHLSRCAQCREDYDQLCETSGKIGNVRFSEPQDEVLNRLWKSPYSRFTRVAGLLLVLGGYGGLLVYALYGILTSVEEDIIPKLALGSIFTGFAILLLMVIRERAHSYKTDPYKEIER